MKKLLSLVMAILPFSGSRGNAAPVSGEATYYADLYEGRTMANGKPFSQMAKTVATYAFPLGTKVRITYTTRRGVARVAYATVTDRGPAQWVRDMYPERLFDFSRSLFKQLENPRVGVIPVTVEAIK